jgi:hypothetical protein
LEIVVAGVKRDQESELFHHLRVYLDYFNNTLAWGNGGLQQKESQRECGEDFNALALRFASSVTVGSRQFPFSVRRRLFKIAHFGPNTAE